MNRDEMISRLDALGVPAAGLLEKSDVYLDERLKLRQQDAATAMATAGLARQAAGVVTHYDEAAPDDRATEWLKGRYDATIETTAPRDSRSFFGPAETALRAAMLAPTPESRADQDAEVAAAKSYFDAEAERGGR
jgi:hypothetical protein